LLVRPLIPVKSVFDTDPFAKFHKYWARKPLEIVSHYLESYSKEGESILDPFMGSGTTLYASLLSNRNSIGYDLNPTACFLVETLSKKLMTVADFDAAINEVNRRIGLKINALYSYDDKTILWRSMHKNSDGLYKAQISDNDFTNKASCAIKQNDESLTRPNFLATEFPPLLKDRFTSKGIRKVGDMFTTRNLIALELLQESISQLDSPAKEHLMICLNNSILHVSKLKGEGIRPLGVNSYWIPNDSIEENLWWRFLERAQNYRKSLTALNNMMGKQEFMPPTIINESSLSMTGLDNSSIDYIFTDPPYGETIQYSELSFIWNTFLNKEYQVLEELVVNSVQGKSADSYLKLASSSLEECFRVLKSGKHMTIAFQSKDIRLWVGLSVILAKLGFELVEIEIAAPKGNPFTANWSTKSPKNDFYITVRKPKAKPKNNRTMTSVTWIDYKSNQLNGEISSKMMKPQDIFQQIVGNIFELPFRGTALIDIPKNALSKILEA
jgi:adenine-specific DNA methylase